MSTPLKVLVALAVLLPVGGFVAGTLAANDTTGTPRETIVISETSERGAGPETTTVNGAAVRPGKRFERAPTPDPTPVPPVVEDDDDDDDDGPEPVIPQPVDVDDDDDDDDRGGDDDDDD